MLEDVLDQASGLRKLFNAQSLSVLPITGGWQLSDLLARTLASNARVVVLDQQGDALLRSFKKTARFELADLLSGARQFNEVAVRINDQLSVVAAEQGIDEFLSYAAQKTLSAESLFAGFMNLAQPFQWLLINTTSLSAAARLTGAHGDALMMLTDTPHSIQKTYADIKAVASQAPGLRLRLAVQAHSEAQARRAFERLAQTAGNFLGIAPQFGLALPVNFRPSAQLGSQLRLALPHWQCAEFMPTEEL